jgi:hypothetical protein
MADGPHGRGAAWGSTSGRAFGARLGSGRPAWADTGEASVQRYLGGRLAGVYRRGGTRGPTRDVVDERIQFRLLGGLVYR